ncbi:uncharacterized protein N7459_010047 [Penicillium hispanicum]|uniref:uncharacterized protein n=1 Tax=Penicillium hispanicum TaxID=1080232 RepID=UPI002541A869|nr:uncharacterized protein N7459_010047 [Penicillium hispanicum]KAJ5570617.1 hypothetical protein N7459_010047 [Penicillium hispanicum]
MGEGGVDFDSVFGDRDSYFLDPVFLILPGLKTSIPQSHLTLCPFGVIVKVIPILPSTGPATSRPSDVHSSNMAAQIQSNVPVLEQIISYMNGIVNLLLDCERAVDHPESLVRYVGQEIRWNWKETNLKETIFDHCDPSLAETNDLTSQLVPNPTWGDIIDEFRAQKFEPNANGNHRALIRGRWIELSEKQFKAVQVIQDHSSRNADGRAKEHEKVYALRDYLGQHFPGQMANVHLVTKLDDRGRRLSEELDRPIRAAVTLDFPISHPVVMRARIERVEQEQNATQPTPVSDAIELRVDSTDTEGSEDETSEEDEKMEIGDPQDKSESLESVLQRIPHSTRVGRLIPYSPDEKQHMLEFLDSRRNQKMPWSQILREYALRFGVHRPEQTLRNILSKSRRELRGRQ